MLYAPPFLIDGEDSATLAGGPPTTPPAVHLLGGVSKLHGTALHHQMAATWHSGMQVGNLPRSALLLLGCGLLQCTRALHVPRGSNAASTVPATPAALLATGVAYTAGVASTAVATPIADGVGGLL